MNKFLVSIGTSMSRAEYLPYLESCAKEWESGRWTGGVLALDMAAMVRARVVRIANGAVNV